MAKMSEVRLRTSDDEQAEIEAWIARNAAKSEGGLVPISAVPLARRSVTSTSQPGDYHCVACGERVCYHLRAPGDRVSVWSRGDCVCERDQRRISEAAAAEAQAEGERNRRAVERARALAAFNLNRRQQAVTFDSLSPFASNQMAAAQRLLERWCDKAISSGVPGKGYLLSSLDVGCGKTHLLLAAANALREVGVQFYNTAELLEAIRAEQRGEPRGEQSPLRMACNIPILILDDLGAPGLATAWQADQLFLILDRRYQAGRPILASSNILHEGRGSRTLAKHLLGPRDTEFPDREVTGRRLESRVLALCQPVLVSGPDLRNGAR